jgi:zinc transport system substrate-binding protein
MNQTKQSLTRIMAIAVAIITLTACGGSESNKSNKLIVSISPLKYIVESITGDDFDVSVMVPDGASPETYTPTPQQLIDMEQAELVFTAGLIDFETELAKKISNTHDYNKIIDLSRGIALIEGGSHSHGNDTGEDKHRHGTDPHTWTSPEQLKFISHNVYNAVMALHPDSVKYTESYQKLLKKLEDVSAEIRAKIAASDTKYFIIYHPALSYYARDYGIEQVSLENEGKEPSAVYMSEIAARGRKDKLKYILYQRQFSEATVESLAADTGATPVAIDPLAEDIIGQLLYITDVITQ